MLNFRRFIKTHTLTHTGKGAESTGQGQTGIFLSGPVFFCRAYRICWLISNDVAMQMVGVGFIIGVIQDSVETALNSAGDVEFAATAEYHQWLKQGKPLPDFLK